MPAVSPFLVQGARVSVSVRFLGSVQLDATLRARLDAGTRQDRLFGTLVSDIVDNQFEVTFDDVPTARYRLRRGCFRFEGPRPQGTARRVAQRARVAANVDSSGSDDDNELEEDEDQAGNPAVDEFVDAAEDFLEDAEETSEEDESSDDEVDFTSWRVRDVMTDARITSNEGIRDIDSRINMPNFRHAAARDYFFRFLPMDHIDQVVIPAINGYAKQHRPNWVDVSFLEYCKWVTLYLIMSIWHTNDQKSYWRRGGTMGRLSIDFNDFMTFSRFTQINCYHVFVAPDLER